MLVQVVRGSAWLLLLQVLWLSLRALAERLAAFPEEIMLFFVSVLILVFCWYQGFPYFQHSVTTAVLLFGIPFLALSLVATREIGASWPFRRRHD